MFPMKLLLAVILGWTEHASIYINTWTNVDEANYIYSEN